MASFFTHGPSYAKVVTRSRSESSNEIIVISPSVRSQSIGTSSSIAGDLSEDAPEDNVARRADIDNSLTADNNDNVSTGDESLESTESNDKEKFIPAPPVKINPWLENMKHNTSAAAILAKKSTPESSSIAPKVLTENIHVSNEKVTGKFQRYRTTSEGPMENKVSNTKFNGSHIKSSQIKNCNKFKDRYPAPPQPVNKCAADWPALNEVLSIPSNNQNRPLSTSTTTKSSNVKKSPATGSSSISSDSGNEELPSPNQLSQDKWPSVSASYSNNSKENSNTKEGAEIDPDSPKTIKSKVKAGSSSTDEGISGEEPTLGSESATENGEENSNKKKTKKSSRQKWVPISSLPEAAPPKPRSPRTYDKSNKFRNADHSGHSEHHAVRPAGRSRGGGGSRGRGGYRQQHSGRSYGHHHNNYHQNFHNNNKEFNDHNGARRYNKDHSEANNRDRDHRNTNNTEYPYKNNDYQDYSPELQYSSNMYPVSEFIMPYVTPFLPWHATELGPYVYGGEEESLLIDIVRNQIEYYFSEENLEKDFYLRRKMNLEGYLPVRLISSFHRVQNLTLDYGLVLTAIRSSKVLEMNATHSYVRTRFNPLIWPITDLNPSVSQQHYEHQQNQPANPTPLTVP